MTARRWRLCSTRATPGAVCWPPGYDSHANRELLAQHQLRDGIARRAKPGQEARQRLDARNRTINKTRARVEHVFAGLEQLGGKLVRAMPLARKELAGPLKCVAYNAKHLVWLVAQGAVR